MSSKQAQIARLNLIIDGWRETLERWTSSRVRPMSKDSATYRASEDAMNRAIAARDALLGIRAGGAA